MARKIHWSFFIFIFQLFCLIDVAGADESTLEFSRAEKEFSTGNFADAEKDYTLALVKYSGMKNFAAYIQTRIGECLECQKKTETAVQAYRNVQANYPASPMAEQSQERIAKAYYNVGDYEKAGPEFEKLLETQKSSKISSASIGSPGFVNREKQNQTAGYAVYSYLKSGNILKALQNKARISHSEKNKEMEAVTK